MKHLRRFNEGISQDLLDELKEFSERLLCYLIDEDFIVQTWSPRDTAMIQLTKDKNENFYWDQVKDHFIPFLTLLSKYYNLEDQDEPKQREVGFCFDEFGWKYYTIDDISQDDWVVKDIILRDKPACIEGIEVRVKSKK
jgi:hypothetical protein